jgi:hypothetical protein
MVAVDYRNIGEVTRLASGGSGDGKGALFVFIHDERRGKNSHCGDDIDFAVFHFFFTFVTAGCGLLWLFGEGRTYLMHFLYSLEALFMTKWVEPS